MKVIKLEGVDFYRHLVRHWGKWYVLLNDGGLLAVDEDWFKKAKDKQKEASDEETRTSGNQ